MTFPWSAKGRNQCPMLPGLRTQLIEVPLFSRALGYPKHQVTEGGKWQCGSLCP